MQVTWQVRIWPYVENAKKDVEDSSFLPVMPGWSFCSRGWCCIADIISPQGFAAGCADAKAVLLWTSLFHSAFAWYLCCVVCKPEGQL